MVLPVWLSEFAGRFKSRNSSAEYYKRNIIPVWTRGIEAGISEERLETLRQQAFAEANGQSTFPGMLFRDLVNQEIDNISS